MIKKTLYNTVALGGTFDHLHDGHKDFLQFAGEIGSFLIIGVTDNNMILQKPLAHMIQPLHARKQAVANFCAAHKIPVKIIIISDPYGPTIEENNIQAIACTSETLAGANKINEIRKNLKLKELPIHVHKLKLDKLGQNSISAIRIRAGEIDRKGNVYTSIFDQNIKLTTNMRDFFSKLQGNIINQPTLTESKNLKIVVGDPTLETFIKNKWPYNLGIFDGKKQRLPYASEILSKLEHVQKTQNQPGMIEIKAVQTIQTWLNNKNFKHIFVDGEEDLTAVIAVLLLPLGSLIYYGQPNQGMVECEVTENIKESFFNILTQT
jgi:pantetheine-phosphate adenylyltransferase